MPSTPSPSTSGSGRARTGCGHPTSPRSTFESTRSTRPSTHDVELRSPRRPSGPGKRAAHRGRRSTSEANRTRGELMATLTMKELLEAGVHFGHQTKRWNPKMQKYIFGERNGIYIIDLQKTLKKFREAYAYRARPRRGRRHRALRGHEEAGPGDGVRGGRPLRDVLRESPLARRHPHQLHDDPEVHRPAQEARRDERDGRVRAAAQEGGHRPRARARRSCRARWSASRTWTACRPPSSSSIPRKRRSRSRRRSAWPSPSWPSSIPIAIRRGSTTPCPATMTRFAPSA